MLRNISVNNSQQLYIPLRQNGRSSLTYRPLPNQLQNKENLYISQLKQHHHRQLVSPSFDRINRPQKIHKSILNKPDILGNHTPKKTPISIARNNRNFLNQSTSLHQIEQDSFDYNMNQSPNQTQKEFNKLFKKRAHQFQIGNGNSFINIDKFSSRKTTLEDDYLKIQSKYGLATTSNYFYSNSKRYHLKNNIQNQENDLSTFPHIHSQMNIKDKPHYIIQQNRSKMRMEIISLKYKLQKWQKKYANMLQYYGAKQSQEVQTHRSTLSPTTTKNYSKKQTDKQDIIDKEIEQDILINQNSLTNIGKSRTHKRVNSNNEQYMNINSCNYEEYCELKSEIKRLHSELIKSKLDNLSLKRKVSRNLQQEDKNVQRIDERYEIYKQKYQKQNKQFIRQIYTKIKGDTNDKQTDIDKQRILKQLDNLKKDKEKVQMQFQKFHKQFIQLKNNNQMLTTSIEKYTQQFDKVYQIKNEQINKLLQQYQQLKQIFENNHNQQHNFNQIIKNYSQEIKELKFKQSYQKYMTNQFKKCYFQILQIFGIFTKQGNRQAQSSQQSWLNQAHQELLHQIKQFKEQISVLINKILSNQAKNQRTNQSDSVQKLIKQVEELEKQVDDKHQELIELKRIQDYQRQVIFGMEQIIKTQNQQLIQKTATRVSIKLQKKSVSFHQSAIPLCESINVIDSSQLSQQLWKSGVSYQSSDN